MFSKTYTLRSDRANAGDGRAMNQFNRDAEKGLSAFDQTHAIKLNYSYELPFGPDKPYLKQGVVSKILGGWRVAGVQSYASGYPLVRLSGLWPAAVRRRQSHHGARLQRLARADAGR